MHSEVVIAHCSKCNREGSRRDNGVPAAWRREYKYVPSINPEEATEFLYCPTCWSTPRLRLVEDAD